MNKHINLLLDDLTTEANDFLIKSIMLLKDLPNDHFPEDKESYSNDLDTEDKFWKTYNSIESISYNFL